MTDTDHKVVGQRQMQALLERLCADKRPALMSLVHLTRFKMRRQLAHVEKDAGAWCLVVKGVSDKAMELLAVGKKVALEISNLKERNHFHTEIFRIEGGNLWLLFPIAISHHDRRQNHRYRLPPQAIAFFSPGIVVAPEEVHAQPVVAQYRHQAQWLAVADISAQGICVETRFPAMLDMIQRYKNFSKAQLIFPMKAPVRVQVQQKWFKRRRAKVEGSHSPHTVVIYRIGFLFVNPSATAARGIEAFIAEAEAQRNEAL